MATSKSAYSSKDEEFYRGGERPKSPYEEEFEIPDYGIIDDLMSPAIQENSFCRTVKAKPESTLSDEKSMLDVSSASEAATSLKEGVVNWFNTRTAQQWKQYAFGAGALLLGKAIFGGRGAKS